MGTVSNVKIEPCNVTWGEDVAQVSKVTAVADSSGSLNDAYFFLYSATNATKYYVWINSSAAGTDPSIAGATGIEVTISDDDTASAVASAIQTAVDNVSDFSATVSSDVVTITNAANGYATGPYDSSGSSATGFSFSVDTEGNKAADVGYIDGDIEVAGLGEDLEPVTAQQEGTDVLGHIRKGIPEIEVTVNFKETTVSQLRKVFTQGGGDTFTPDGSSSTEVYGMGTSKRFTHTLTQASELNLHPATLGSSDKSRDLTFWKAYPQLDTLTFSGESIMTIPVTFTIYPDSAKREEIRYFAYGDGTQTLT